MKPGAPLSPQLDRAIELLSRVEDELAPNHDAAQELTEAFGLNPPEGARLIGDIREFLALIEGRG